MFFQIKFIIIKPLPENFVADSVGNCKVKYSLFIKSDVPIKSIETSPSATNPFGELNKLNTTFSFQIISNLASPNFTLTVIITDNNLKEFRDSRIVYCVKLNDYGPTTEYLLQPKENKPFLNGVISKSSNTGKISGPLIVVEYISNTPPLLKSLYPNAYDFLIKPLGNKKTSKFYKFKDASQERAIRNSSQNSYVYPAFNDGFTPNYPLFSGNVNIQPEDYSQGKEMLLLFDGQLMNNTPTAFAVVLSRVPLLPQYPIKLIYPSGFERQLWLNQNPFSLKNGFRKDSIDTYEIVFTTKLSKYSRGLHILKYNSTSNLTFEATPKPELIVDSPLEIIMVRSFNIGRMKIDIQISIIDNISGFSAFVCLDTNEIIFDYKNLKIGGTINNGVYSFIYDYGFTPVCKKSAFLDFAVSNGMFNYFSIDLPITKPKTLSDFDQFYFAFNNIDLTNQGFYNTLLFKFKDNNNNPDYCIKFRLAISEG
ncbi:hypothetical protein ACTFIY_002196 [Dictyostelium cf. discoideum]